VRLELRRGLDAGEGASGAPSEIADAVAASGQRPRPPLAAARVFGCWTGVIPGSGPCCRSQRRNPGQARASTEFRRLSRWIVLAALGDAGGDPALAEALDRWSSLFQNDPFRAEQLRASLSALLGET
jgi:hypothetical protein